MAAALADEFDAVVVAAGACQARGVNAGGLRCWLGVGRRGVRGGVPGRAGARALLEGRKPAIAAAGKDVVVIGGGDTGNDCMGTAVRQGARTVRQLEYGPCAPEERAASNAWPRMAEREEGGLRSGRSCRRCRALTCANGVPTRRRCCWTRRGTCVRLQVRTFDWSAGKPQAVEGSEREIDAQLVLVACGFAGPEHGVFDAFGVPAGHARPSPAGDGRRLQFAPSLREQKARREARRFYAAGDARNGSSLVVNAMADALKCAAEVAGDLGL